MINRGCGGIGRHDGLKIRCLVIVRGGSSPPIPKHRYTVIKFYILTIFGELVVT